jgi:hypothetical protein
MRLARLVRQREDFCRSWARRLAALRSIPAWLRLRLTHARPMLHELAPAAIPVALLPWLWRCATHLIDAPLFYDIGMFRYTGWCLLHGQRLYRDILSPDGPLIHFLHAALLIITGASESRFREADVLIHALAGGVVGWLLAPERGRMTGSPLPSRVAWALLGTAVWLSWDFQLDWFETGQRENFYAVGGITGMALLYAASDAPLRHARWMLPVGGALVGSIVLGKHTGAVYLLLGLVSVVVAPAADVRTRWHRASLTAAGAAAAIVGLLLAVAATGDLKGWAFWYFRYPFEVYIYFGRGRLVDLFSEMDPDYAHFAALCSFAGIIAIARGLLARKAIGFVLAPAALYATALLQAKGWRYHFTATRLAAHVLLLLGASMAWELAGKGEPLSRDDGSVDPTRSHTKDWIAWAALLLVGVRCLSILEVSPWVKKVEGIGSPMCPDMRKAAVALQGLTKIGDRVFYYGDDSHLLMFAERLPANPYHASFARHFRDALAATEANPRKHASIERLKKVVGEQVCGRIMRFPPAAFVFSNNGSDAYDDTMYMCPAARQLLESEYVLRETIGSNRIFVPRAR